jgi:hypothetical protein
VEVEMPSTDHQGIGFAVETALSPIPEAGQLPTSAAAWSPRGKAALARLFQGGLAAAEDALFGAGQEGLFADLSDRGQAGPALVLKGRYFSALRNALRRQRETDRVLSDSRLGKKPNAVAPRPE